MPTHKAHIAIPYFIAISIDAIGFTIIGPILVPLINQLVSNSGLSQHLLYGAILSIYSLSFMFGAPILGALSDILGRRKVLIIASFGVLIGYICYAISLSTNKLSFLILGRVITGFCAASQCIAQAAMVDVSQNNSRVNNIGLIASAMTAGLVVGPLASIALSSHELNIDALKTPFYAITSTLVLNLIFLIGFLKESHVNSTFNKEVNLLKTQTRQFFKQFTHKKMALLFSIFFLFELGWSLYYQSLTIELATHLKLNPHEIALLLSFIGIVLTIALLSLVRISSRYLKTTKVYSAALCIGGLTLIAQFIINNLLSHYLFALIISSVVALSYTGLVAQLSEQTDSKNQGLLMGSTDAVLALAFTITGVLAGYLSFASTNLPLLVAALLWSLAFIVSLAAEKK